MSKVTISWRNPDNSIGKKIVEINDEKGEKDNGKEKKSPNKRERHKSSRKGKNTDQIKD